LARTPFRSGELASISGDLECGNGFDNAAAGVVERFVGGKTPGRHRIGHRM
jgi:hypothetical protein